MKISSREELEAARAHTDGLFALVEESTLYKRPIPDRHRLIFYLGHLDAFDWNQLARGALGEPSFEPELDRLFEAGIDPEPGKAPSDGAQDWPSFEHVTEYCRRTRAAIDQLWDQVPSERQCVALEHRWMHAETLAYLLHQLDPSVKRRPSRAGIAIDLSTPPIARAPWVDIPAGDTLLGQQTGEFGWDNEFPRHTVPVPAFQLSRFKVTNGDYLRFVDAGGPAPFFWQRDLNGWWLREMFDLVPLPLDSPVYLTHDQASEYAAWSGARLPTESEWQRAAYLDGVHPYPWGSASPTAAHGNFDFLAWDPMAVTSHPDSETPQGVEQMLGNGWEWTATTFSPFDGFDARPYYPGYSANFFDGQHFVLKGASPRTARRLTRPSFRNWFRREYPYVYATARLVRDA
ncbi:MAG: SUMF1/EgtB/PvdO family nonheme iron enzyme [Burkholderiaceae bacterium]